MSDLDVGQIVKAAFDETEIAHKVVFDNTCVVQSQQGTVPWLVKGIPFQVTLGDMALNKWDYLSVLPGTDTDVFTVSGAAASINGEFTVMYTDGNKTAIDSILFA